MRFGGYTEKTWNGKEVKMDNPGIAFCYSLDLFKIYNYTDKIKNYIYCNCLIFVSQKILINLTQNIHNLNILMENSKKIMK